MLSEVDANRVDFQNTVYRIVGWVLDQIKTDTEERTPAINCSNFFVALYFSPKIKAVVNMKVLPR